MFKPGMVKVNGADCGLSEPFVNDTERVKLVMYALRVTWQSMDVAEAEKVRHVNSPS